jgi:4-hydroxy-tetrahydrodipicolinate synthase
MASLYMFHGSLVALVTPMTEQGDIDFSALSRLVDFHIDNGTDGLVVAGTTGESAALTDKELEALLRAVVGQVDGRIPVIAGTGSASTNHTISSTQLAGQVGADAALVVTPYYVRPMQQGLEAHFRAIADASTIPLILYNVPSRTSVDMSVETTVSLARHESIVAIKEALPDMKRIGELVKGCGPDFVVLSGDDPSCLAAMKKGARGVISVVANVVPDRIRSMVACAAAARWHEAEEINRGLGELIRLLATETNPIPVKWCVFEMGLIGSRIRLPMTMLQEPRRLEMRRCLESMGCLRHTG